MTFPQPRQRVPFPPGFLQALDRVPPWTWNDPDPGVVAEFEVRAASFLGVRHAVATTSGRQALALILRGLGLAPGARVAVPAFTFFAVPAVVRNLGMEPVFVDVDSDTFHVTPALLGDCLRSGRGIGAAIVTHTFGAGAPVADIAALCGEAGIPVIEDRAHLFPRRPQGNLRGIAGFHSLETTKPLSALSGGLAVTDDDRLADTMRGLVGTSHSPLPVVMRALFRQVGHSVATWPPFFALTGFPAALALSLVGRDLEDRSVRGDERVLVGSPSRLHAFQAALALAGLRVVDAENARRASLAMLMDSNLDPRVRRQRFEPGAPMLMFTVVSQDREGMAKRLLFDGVDTKREFLSDCAGVFAAEGSFPSTVALARGALHLPFHPWLGDAEVLRIAAAVNRLW